ncbi:hypothetical protein C8F01DRAFT_1143401, partial [Mycena amicta]
MRIMRELLKSVAVVVRQRQELRQVLSPTDPAASEPPIPVVVVVCRKERKRKKRSVPAQLRWCSPTWHSNKCANEHTGKGPGKPALHRTAACPGKRDGVGIGRRAGRRKYILRFRRRDVLVVVWRRQRSCALVPWGDSTLVQVCRGVSGTSDVTVPIAGAAFPSSPSSAFASESFLTIPSSRRKEESEEAHALGRV